MTQRRQSECHRANVGVGNEQLNETSPLERFKSLTRRLLTISNSQLQKERRLEDKKKTKQHERSHD